MIWTPGSSSRRERVAKRTLALVEGCSEEILDKIEAFLNDPLADWKKPASSESENGYIASFAAGLEACKKEGVRGGNGITPDDFPEDGFGTVGSGYVLDKPLPTPRRSWGQDQVDTWIREHYKRGFHGATLADAFYWIPKNPEAYREGPVVFWNAVSMNGEVVCFEGSGGDRYLTLKKKSGGYFGCRSRFLLRQIQKTA